MRYALNSNANNGSRYALTKTSEIYVHETVAEFHPTFRLVVSSLVLLLIMVTSLCVSCQILSFIHYFSHVLIFFNRLLYNSSTLLFGHGIE